MYDPVSEITHFEEHVVCRLEIWSMKISKFRFHIGHISGDFNVWGDTFPDGVLYLTI